MWRFLRASCPWHTLFPALFAGIMATRGAEAQQPTPAELARWLAAHDALVGAAKTAALWPGFRPDTTAFVYVIPERGQLLVNWRGGWPEGYVAVVGRPGVAWLSVDAKSAASTSTTLAGRTVAQLVVRDAATPALAGLAAHEAFHAFQGSVRGETHNLGQGENSYLVSSYPVFDTANEAGVALEGRLLAQALRAGTASERTEQARRFLAVRAARQRALAPELAEFEAKTELNEGLAEYIGLRVTSATGGEAMAATLSPRLHRLTRDPVQSMRLRFYQTGAAQAILLDRLAPGWKDRFMTERVTLGDLLGRAVGGLADEERLRADAARAENLERLTAETAATLAGLQARRRGQIDSILAKPGVLLTIDGRELPGKFIGWCGIDPQNLLRANATTVLHTRWVRPCSGKVFDLEFNTPVVQDERAVRLQAVVGPPDALRITAGGQPVTLEPGREVTLTNVRIETPVVTGKFARARLLLAGTRPHGGALLSLADQVVPF